MRAGHTVELVADAGRVPAVGDSCKPFQLGERQSERLADVADRAAAAIARKRRDERRVLAAVALGDAHDQLLADVARKVEVDVGHGDHLVVDEAAERQARCDGIDVREAGQVADDRADAGAAAAPRWQRVPGTAGPAHLERALAGELEHLPVEQEEPREAEPRDQCKLVVEPLSRTFLVAVRICVSLGECPIADHLELPVCGVGSIGEVGVAIAELLRQVERAAVGELAGPTCRICRQAFEHRLRRKQHRFVVSAPLALAAVERRAVLDRNECVLQPRPRRTVRVHVAGRDGGHAEVLGELGEPRVPSRVATLVRALQLDGERAGEGAREPLGRFRVDHGKAVPGAAGECDEPFRVAFDDLDRRLGRQEVALLARFARSRMRIGEDAAEVGVALPALAKERHVTAACERHLGAGDRPDAEVLRGVCELERAVDTVVVGERERVVAELGGACGELLRQGRAVEERVGGVRVQLDVRRRRRRRRAVCCAFARLTLVADPAASRKRVARGERHRARNCSVPPCPRGARSGV